MFADDVKRLRLLEQEHSRLKKILAERDLEIGAIMKEIAKNEMVGGPVRRIQMECVMSRGLSQRRARAFLSYSRSSLHYESRLEARDEPLIGVMAGLAATCPRFEYRRINVFMKRLGLVMGADKALSVVQGRIAGAE